MGAGWVNSAGSHQSITAESCWIDGEGASHKVKEIGWVDENGLYSKLYTARRKKVVYKARCTLPGPMQGCSSAATSDFVLFSTAQNGAAILAKTAALDKNLVSRYAADLSAARSIGAGASAGSYAVFAGGTTTAGANNEVDAYDNNLQITSPAPLVAARRLLAAAHFPQCAVFAGGSGWGYDFDQVEQYDGNLLRKSLAPLSQPRGGMPGGRIGDKMVFPGGQNFTGSRFDVVDAYDLDLLKIDAPRLSIKRSGCMCAKAGNYLLVAGGYLESKTFVDTIDVFNEHLMRVSTLALSDADFYQDGEAELGEYAVFVGYDNTHVDVFDANLLRTSASPLTLGRTQIKGNTLGNIAFFAGGRTTTASVTNVDTYTLE